MFDFWPGWCLIIGIATIPLCRLGYWLFHRLLDFSPDPYAVALNALHCHLGGASIAAMMLWFCLLPNFKSESVIRTESASVQSMARLQEYLQERDSALQRNREVTVMFLVLFCFTLGWLPNYIHRMTTAYADKTKRSAALSAEV
jgi:hypothetical protein